MPCDNNCEHKQHETQVFKIFALIGGMVFFAGMAKSLERYFESASAFPWLAMILAIAVLAVSVWVTKRSLKLAAYVAAGTLFLAAAFRFI